MEVALVGAQCNAALPAAPLQLVALQRAGSLGDLEAAVAADPGRWCDGTAPGDAPLQGMDYQTLCAGELLALLQGQRGAAMVQLHVGWDTGSGGGGEGGGSAAVAPPVINPLALEVLRQVLTCPDITFAMSKAPGGLGLTAILTTKRQPWRAWGAHLASFGAQASLVADSPFYKLLIGRVMGYKEENIIHHIRVMNGRGQPAPQVVVAVGQELAKLSNKKPNLPWNADVRGKKRR